MGNKASKQQSNDQKANEQTNVQRGQENEAASKKSSNKSNQSTSKRGENKTSPEDRSAMNDRARFDYGIMNAEQMSDEQLKAEMKSVDDQVKVGERENKAAEADRGTAERNNSNVNSSF